MAKRGEGGLTSRAQAAATAAFCCASAAWDSAACAFGEEPLREQSGDEARARTPQRAREKYNRNELAPDRYPPPPQAHFSPGLRGRQLKAGLRDGRLGTLGPGYRGRRDSCRLRRFARGQFGPRLEDEAETQRKARGEKRSIRMSERSIPTRPRQVAAPPEHSPDLGGCSPALLGAKLLLKLGCTLRGRAS